MPEPAIDPADFKSRAELTAGLQEILSAPKQNGTLELILMRPGRGERITPAEIEVSAAKGVSGDHWINGTGHAKEDGTGDPCPASAPMRQIGHIEQGRISGSS
jgi:hypothetical protein